jgi:hypothetical protein
MAAKPRRLFSPIRLAGRRGRLESEAEAGVGVVAIGGRVIGGKGGVTEGINEANQLRCKVTNKYYLYFYKYQVLRRNECVFIV